MLWLVHDFTIYWRTSRSGAVRVGPVAVKMWRSSLKRVSLQLVNQSVTIPLWVARGWLILTIDCFLHSSSGINFICEKNSGSTSESVLSLDETSKRVSQET
jgi:hypothetical protein